MKLQYCKRDELTCEIRKSQEAGKPTETLLRFARRIAEGIAFKRRIKNKADVEDYGTRAILEVFKKLSKFDTSKNCFAYLTSIINSLFTHDDQQQRRREAVHLRAVQSGSFDHYRSEENPYENDPQSIA